MTDKIASVAEVQHALYRLQPNEPAFWIDEAIAIHFDGFSRKNLLPNAPKADWVYEYSRENPYIPGQFEKMRAGMLDTYTHSLPATIRLVARHLGIEKTMQHLSSIAAANSRNSGIVDVRDVQGILARELLLRSIPEMKAADVSG